MDKQISPVEAINYVLNFGKLAQKHQRYYTLYQIALLAGDSESAAIYYQASSELSPDNLNNANVPQHIENKLLKTFLFPKSFQDCFDEMYEDVQNLLEEAIEKGNTSAINAKALALANSCPCTGWTSQEDDPSDQQHKQSLKTFLAFAKKHESDLNKEVSWLVKYAVAKNREREDKMDFSISDLKTNEKKPKYATQKEWEAYQDMLRFENSYSKRISVLNSIADSALNKYFAALLLESDISTIEFFEDMKYTIVEDDLIDAEVGEKLCQWAAAEGCYNAQSHLNMELIIE